MTLLENFLKYVSVDTTSDSSGNITQGQIVLAKFLIQQLKELNVDEIYFDEQNCYVYAKIKGEEDIPKLGFVSHLDTSSSASGKNIKPNVVYNYDGKDLVLNKNIVLSMEEYGDLQNHIGKTLITTDGTTLLGADDKAGIAEIMQMIERIKTENIQHGDIFICFTPNEEVGLGTRYLDYNTFRPNFAYTVDGSSLGELSYENFNAAKVKIIIRGNSTHTGTAKGKMINALRIAIAINDLLPNEIPEKTEGYEGFYHLEKLSGDVSYAEVEYLIRDFDNEEFINKKQKLSDIVIKLNRVIDNRIELNIQDTYYNMKDIVNRNPQIIEKTKEAMKKANIEPIIMPIRGGTDGASITRKGIICPNIGTGAHNFHSVYEYAVLEDMEKTVEILVSIVKEFANKKN